MNIKLKFAIVGCGRIAQRHAEHINNLGILIAVCDNIKDNADYLGKKYNSEIYYNIDDLLNSKLEIDVISICTPNGLHAEHSIKSLKSGFNVLCEKPIAINSIDAGEMIKAAEASNKRLFAIKQNRFNPPVSAIKKAIEDNKFGKINNIQLNCFWNRNEDYYKNSWKGTKALDGGTLFTQFSHFIDLLYWLIGDVKKTSALISNFTHQGIIEFEDTGVVILEFVNGTIGTINYTVNSYNKNMEGSLTIFGEKGTAKIGGQYLNELEYQQFEDFEIKDLPAGNKPNNYGNYVGSMSNHDLVYKNVIDVINNGASISTNSFEALKTVEIIEKIYNSAKII
jgi:UDP-N-acetyl-2-amino-2-deoxyglucuronate dehydrogenase